MFQVILPLKGLAVAKGRLADVLDPDSRRSLVVAMASDSLDMLDRAPCVSRITVVAGPLWDRYLPRSRSIQLFREQELGVTGLNAVLERTVDLLPPQKTLIVHGDLPSLSSADIQAVHQRLQSEALLLCPDQAGGGTNGLAFHASARPAFRFGSGSYAAHQDIAVSLGCAWGNLETGGFGFDVDLPTDLRVLLRAADTGQHLGPRTAAWALRNRAALAAVTRGTNALGRSLPTALAGSA